MEICFSFSVVIILSLFPEHPSTPHLDFNFFSQLIGRQTLLYGHRLYIDRPFKVCAYLWAVTKNQVHLLAPLKVLNFTTLYRVYMIWESCLFSYLGEGMSR